MPCGGGVENRWEEGSAQSGEGGESGLSIRPPTLDRLRLAAEPCVEGVDHAKTARDSGDLCQDSLVYIRLQPVT